MEHHPQRPALPAIPAPPPFAERRKSFRRAEDVVVHEERALLARALDVLAGPADAATQVAEILTLVARVVGARRAAMLTDRPQRRVLVAAAPGEASGDARSLAGWLDAATPRPAAVRAARGPADIVVVRTRRGHPGVSPNRRVTGATADRLLRLDVAGVDIQLALELVDPADAPAAAARLPASTLRHLLAALAAAGNRADSDAERTELRARERERERFVSMVAHELRTPLTGLGGYLDLLADGAVDDPAIGREFIERGRGIVERMAALVGDLLELSRVEAGSLRLEIEAVSISEACERAMATLAPVASARRIRLVADLPPRLRTVRADRRRLEQVVTNLAANACKFTQAGGLVEVAAVVEGVAALIVVRDDGAGIERADRERIFRPFTRLERQEAVPGTGLGLAISRDLARAMGGEIGIASVPGSGSAFVVGLPSAADIPRTAVLSAMAASLDREESGLEERAILRAIRVREHPPIATGSGGAPQAGERDSVEPAVDAA